MKRPVCVIVRGRTSQWGLHLDMSKDQIAGMREDGIEVDEVLHSIPEWVANAHLTGLWMFAHDVFAFRNPFRR